MNIEEIGANAGIIWNELNSNGRMTVGELKFITKFTDFDLHTAIGWLARENKLAFDGDSVELL